MKLLNLAKGIVSDFVQSVSTAWWVEVSTTEPRCVYYFGPFASSQEAETARPGYLEDLEREGAKGILTNIKRCKPKSVTIVEGVAE